MCTSSTACSTRKVVADLGSGQVRVAVFGAPEPATLPGGFTRYAVVIEDAAGALRWFDLMRAADGASVGGQDYATALSGTGTVRLVPVTALDGEPILTGNLVNRLAPPPAGA